MEVSIQVRHQDGWDFVHYVGPINEEAEVHLMPLLKQVGAKAVFNFKQVEYVNSCGVRAWINFMREVEKGRQVVFEECTPEIVMQVNMIPSFKASAVIKSVYASYACESCGHHQNVLFEAGKNLPSATTTAFPQIACESCNAPTQMEEMEDEFFAFSMAS